MSRSLVCCPSCDSPLLILRASVTRGRWRRVLYGLRLNSLTHGAECESCGHRFDVTTA